MALEGNVRDFSISDIFQLIGLQRKTGELTLKSKDDTVVITFLDGRVVNADSEKYRLESRLGKVLLKRGSLTEEKLAHALTIQKETLQRLGYVLVKNGLISNEELKKALTQQILEIVYRIFRWREGEYHFSQETSVEYDRESIIPITSESILMEGAQMLDEWPIIERQIRSGVQVFEKTSLQQAVQVGEDQEFEFEESGKKVARPHAHDEVIKLSQTVYDIYQIVDGHATVSELVERSRSNEFQVCKALYELVSRSLIQEKKERHEAPEPVVKAAPEPAVPSPPTKSAVIPVTLLLLIFLGCNLFRFKNPINDITSLLTKRNLVDTLQYGGSFLSVHRVDLAVQTYYLTQSAYPSGLQDLVNRGFVTEKDLLDPWGHSYIYYRQGESYFLIGLNKDGTHQVELIFTYVPSEGLETKGDEGPRRKPMVILE